jgi:hypothetical protein
VKKATSRQLINLLIERHLAYVSSHMTPPRMEKQEPTALRELDTLQEHNYHPPVQKRIAYLKRRLAKARS